MCGAATRRCSPEGDDHALGDSDSSQLCTRLKERDIPYVIYSGFSKIDGVCADGPLVQKPASTEVLVATVEALLPSALENPQRP
jgi:hypothetical protein